MGLDKKKKVWSLRYTPGNCDVDTKIKEIAHSLGLSPTIARLIYNRGHESVRAAERFMNPSVETLHSPFELKDMDKATKRVLMAVEAGEKITVYGD